VAFQSTIGSAVFEDKRGFWPPIFSRVFKLDKSEMNVSCSHRAWYCDRRLPKYSPLLSWSLDMPFSQLQPNEIEARVEGVKRSHSESEAESPKRQKLNRQADVVDIDPAGDLMITFEHPNTIAYKVVSNALRRASLELYEQCLAVRPSGGADWLFELEPSLPGPLQIFSKTAKVILDLIHSNMDQVPLAMSYKRVRCQLKFSASTSKQRISVFNSIPTVVMSTPDPITHYIPPTPQLYEIFLHGLRKHTCHLTT
jgi:hypothetical protein